jgi:hypothetical protein
VARRGAASAAVVATLAMLGVRSRRGSSLGDGDGLAWSRQSGHCAVYSVLYEV